MSQVGMEVTLLCTPTYPDFGLPVRRLSQLLDPPRGANRKLRQIRFAVTIFENFRRLRGCVKRTRPDVVFFANFPTWLVHFWGPGLEKHKRQGTIFASMLHDPDLSYVVGPRWIYESGVRRSFDLMDRIFVHHDIDLSHWGAKVNAKLTTIPCGPFSAGNSATWSPTDEQTSVGERTAHPHTATQETNCSPIASNREARARLGIGQNEHVLLVFGHLRDNKRLDLILAAMSHIDFAPWLAKCLLVVAGDEPSGQRFNYAAYLQMATDLNVDSRCRWLPGYASDELTEDLFRAADSVLLNYDAGFRSASGVLNVASRFDLPVLASGGDGPLRVAVEEFGLGVTVDPGDVRCLAIAMKDILDWKKPTEGWAKYRRHNNWSSNARLIQSAIESLITGPL